MLPPDIYNNKCLLQYIFHQKTKIVSIWGFKNVYVNYIAVSVSEDRQFI